MSGAARRKTSPASHRFTIRDRTEIERLGRTIRRREKAGRPVSILKDKLDRRIVEAESRMAARRSSEYRLEYPDELPISRVRTRILEALAEHRVLVVCGDTGSGKTTQLPKICLEAGRGITGMIGHTQPRRLAAHSVASRLAEELGTNVGASVGVKVRFSDSTRPETLVKVMTDGILLNEIRDDRRLDAYDTLIIDEAHERSLNIDFLLGYLKTVLERRDDLKVIITSATIDPERFAEHFGGAPVIRVEGRTYPVEVRYRPRTRGVEIADAVVDAARELADEPLEPLGGGTARDMLVFLPGERWIRDTQAALERAGPRGYEILPLYARLSAERQQRIFAPGGAPRIVLATNIAETSLTVPRIRFVVDAGLARISRYEPRHRVQRLNVEPIARANAVQRAGRCGRIAPGVCVRLYSEQDFDGRPAFMEPETLRTNLAGVILRLEAMQLGHLAEFPFIDAPPAKAVNDGYRLLHVLGALDADRRLTADGEAMGRLPVDPRLGRLLLAASRNGSLRDALVIAAALSVPDPREQRGDRAEHGASRARDEQSEARAREDPRSDFTAWLDLWRAYRAERRKGAKSFRAWCKRESLSPARLSEWSDVHAQLAEIAAGLDRAPGQRARGNKALHQAVLAAFVDYVFEHTEGKRYRGVHDASARLFPGSSVARKPPRWIVAAEHVALAEPMLRTAAKIDPRWVPEAAPHLVEHDYVEPVWNRERGRVLAREVVKLLGLRLGSGRHVDFGGVDAARAREIFVRDALAADDLGAAPAFLVHNRRVRQTVLDWEARQRSRDLYIGDRALEAHYDARVPQALSSRRALMRWCRKRGNDVQLRLEAGDIVTHVPGAEFAHAYPETLECAGQTLPLEYRFDPADERDGVTVRVPAVLVESLRADDVDWLVPGWLEDKVLGLLRTLPKESRRPLVPLPDTAAELAPRLRPQTGRRALVDALTDAIAERFGLELEARAFRLEQLARHLVMRIEVVGERGQVLAHGRDLLALQREFASTQTVVPAELPRDAAVDAWCDAGLTRWSCADLPERVELDQRGLKLALYPAFVDVRGRVDLTLLPPGPVAAERHRRGVRRLFVLGLAQQAGMIRDRVRADRALLLSFHGIGSEAELVDDVLLAAADECFDTREPPRRRDDFERDLERGRAGLVPAAERLVELLRTTLDTYRTLKRRLESPAVRIPETARADIEAQLASLVRPYMLSETPVEWRGRLPRYLDAIGVRLDKLEQRHPKDAESQARVERARARFDAWHAQLPPDWPLPAAVARYLWLIEEFRISLFAQAIGTARPVSEKRLEQAWRDAVDEA